MIQKIGPVNLKGKVYDSLKKYILSLNIYLKQSDFHLDERQLSEKLGVSRTPIREAVAKLEQEGIVKTVPRRGVFVHRKSKKELAEILQSEPNTQLIAGATDVGLWVNKEFQKFTNIAFLNQVSDFCNIEELQDAWQIGAGVSIEKLRNWAFVEAPSFSELLTRYGSTQVRNAATLGGNIANGSPIGDSAPALIAMETELILRSAKGQRTIKLENFFLDYKKQDLREGEFLEYLIIPKTNMATKCYKISKRFDQDISSVCGCFNFILNDGLLKKCVIAFGGMAGIPKRAFHLESKLLNQPWEEGVLRASSDSLKKDFTPLSDLRSSSEYRQTSAHNLLLRCYYETLGSNTNVQQVEP